MRPKQVNIRWEQYKGHTLVSTETGEVLLKQDQQQEEHEVAFFRRVFALAEEKGYLVHQDDRSLQLTTPLPDEVAGWKKMPITTHLGKEVYHEVYYVHDSASLTYAFLRSKAYWKVEKVEKPDQFDYVTDFASDNCVEVVTYLIETLRKQRLRGLLA